MANYRYHDPTTLCIAVLALCVVTGCNASRAAHHSTIEVRLEDVPHTIVIGDDARLKVSFLNAGKTNISFPTHLVIPEWTLFVRLSRTDCNEAIACIDRDRVKPFVSVPDPAFLILRPGEKYTLDLEESGFQWSFFVTDDGHWTGQYEGKWRICAIWRIVEELGTYQPSDTFVHSRPITVNVVER